MMISREGSLRAGRAIGDNMFCLFNAMDWAEALIFIFLFYSLINIIMSQVSLAIFLLHHGLSVA